MCFSLFKKDFSISFTILIMHTSVKNLSILLRALFWTAIVAGHRTHWKKLERFAGWSLGKPYLTERVTGELNCIFYCMHNSECFAVSYVINTAMCSYLSSTNLIFYREDERHAVVIVRNKTAISLQARESKYSYTLIDAMKVCSSFGGRLMTKQELLTLYYTGFGQCGCGWLEGGDLYYPMQQPEQTCGGGATGMISCFWTPLAHAWCTLK